MAYFLRPVILLFTDAKRHFTMNSILMSVGGGMQAGRTTTREYYVHICSFQFHFPIVFLRRAPCAIEFYCGIAVILKLKASGKLAKS